MVHEQGSPGFDGLRLQKPVILPLSRARGSRCSVKPASRSALSFRDNETYAFAQVSEIHSQLGTGRPT
ncbi:hypothetical protein VNO77_05318 [Canavalia gladiata]|uniref:Uncharacterized protein n=1 Tax=Canavalia gladiata TaxID=3824 RepID=A0AAN9N3B9_CANGL